MTVLNNLDNPVMTRQDAGEQMFWPALQRFGKQRVVGVAKALACDRDRLGHLDPMHIMQQAHKLGASDGPDGCR